MRAQLFVPHKAAVKTPSELLMVRSTSINGAKIFGGENVEIQVRPHKFDHRTYRVI